MGRDERVLTCRDCVEYDGVSGVLPCAPILLAEFSMPGISIKCPSCGARLSASLRDAGRATQCPGCEHVFAAEPSSAKSDGTHALPAEYGDRTVVVLAGGLVLMLLTMAAAALVSWRGSFVVADKTAVAISSLVCAVYMGVSVLGKQSMSPAILAAGAWGTVALFWLGDMLPASGGAVPIGLYVAIAAGALTVGTSAHLVLRFRGTGVYRRIGVVFIVLSVVAACAGLIIVRRCRARRPEGSSMTDGAAGRSTFTG